MILEVFLEVDEHKQPIYKDEFLKCYSAEPEKETFWISEEYAKLLGEDSNINRKNVCIISSEILNKIDSQIRSPKDRALSLEIQRSSEIEEAFSEVVEHCNAKLALLRGSYLSINQVCMQRNINEYIHREGISGVDGSIEYLRTKVAQLEAEHIKLFEQKYTDEQTIQSLRECLSSTEQYLNELQAHATKLDKELSECKNDENRMAELEREVVQKDKYIQLYKEKLYEVDKLKTQLLDNGIVINK